MKTVCRLEKRQFETLDRILDFLAVHSIVAWRMMYLPIIWKELAWILTAKSFFRRANGRQIHKYSKQKPLLRETPPDAQ